MDFFHRMRYHDFIKKTQAEAELRGALGVSRNAANCVADPDNVILNDIGEDSATSAAASRPSLEV